MCPCVNMQINIFISWKNISWDLVWRKDPADKQACGSHLLIQLADITCLYVYALTQTSLQLESHLLWDWACENPNDKSDGIGHLTWEWYLGQFLYRGSVWYELFDHAKVGPALGKSARYHHLQYHAEYRYSLGSFLFSMNYLPINWQYLKTQVRS